MNTTKKILITGASGFIGVFLVKEALNRGYEVWAGVRASSSRENLQDKRIRFIDLKYNDIDALTKQLNEFTATNGRWDYIIHNAGLTKTTRKELFYRINATYTHHLIEALNRSACIP
ncbi:MAG: NAD-dependent epimerase/dehydratase family protein, partial [Tannerellaceae bacterium]|nr:NAD-dependent epimerase/dehydratase family protein [Tannerellaceae bacterium]